MTEHLATICYLLKAYIIALGWLYMMLYDGTWLMAYVEMLIWR